MSRVSRDPFPVQYPLQHSTAFPGLFSSDPSVGTSGYLLAQCGCKDLPHRVSFEEEQANRWTRIERELAGVPLDHLKRFVFESNIPLKEVTPILDNDKAKGAPKEILLHQLTAAALVADLKKRKVGGDFPGVVLQLLTSWRIQPDDGKQSQSIPPPYDPRRNRFLFSKDRFELAKGLYLAYGDFKHMPGTALEASTKAHEMAALAGGREKSSWTPDANVFGPQVQLLFEGVNAKTPKEQALEDEALTVLRERFTGFEKSLAGASTDTLAQALDQALQTIGGLDHFKQLQAEAMAKMREFDSLSSNARERFSNENRKCLSDFNLVQFGAVRAIAIMALLKNKGSEQPALGEWIETAKKTFFLFPPTAYSLPSYFRDAECDGC